MSNIMSTLKSLSPIRKVVFTGEEAKSAGFLPLAASFYAGNLFGRWGARKNLIDSGGRPEDLRILTWGVKDQPSLVSNLLGD